MSEKVTAIILAGGTGKRMGSRLPKQFLSFAGKPIIIHTIQKFEKIGLISDIVVVCHKDHLKKLNHLIERYKIRKVYRTIEGGKTRQGSSYIGVKSCPAGTKYVLIHDAVRPFVVERIIKDTLSAAKKYGASGAAVDTGDTIVVTKGEFIKSIPARETLKRMQTPQGFSYAKILKAHGRAFKNGLTDFTDDCGLVLAAGGSVKLIKGSPLNIKLTNRNDLIWCENFLKTKRPSGTP